MSAMKHTPSPWLVCREPGSPNELVINALIGGQVWCIALVHAGAPPDDNSLLANALLIAQAPPLLALARKVASECAECNGKGYTVHDQDCEDCSDVRAVIRLATTP